MINHEIEELEERKNSLNINPYFKEELDELSKTKYRINSIASKKNALDIRRNLILKAQQEMDDDRSNTDLQQLSAIYQQANAFVPKLQHSFAELVTFHNSMISEKIKFICQSLPELEKDISEYQIELDNLLKKEMDLSVSISKSSSYEELEKFITELNTLYNKKGEYEASLKQIEDVEEEIEKISSQLDDLNKDTESKDYQELVQSKLDDFNSYFSDISKRLYGESYGISAELVPYKKTGHELYQFSSFNANLSTGKKLGEMTCFDLAYDLFARKNNIPHVEFVMHDKNELMSDNQLLKIAKIVEENNIQFVAPILKDKLPQSMNNNNYYILRLSQHDKLFRI